MLRRLLTAAAVLGTSGVVVASPAFMATKAAAETPKCKNKANKHVACTDKLRANTRRKAINFHYGKIEYRYRPTQAPSVVPSGSVRFRVDSPTPSGSAGPRR